MRRLFTWCLFPEIPPICLVVRGRDCVTIIASDSHDNVMINHHHTTPHRVWRHRTPNIRTSSHQINISPAIILIPYIFCLWTFSSSFSSFSFFSSWLLWMTWWELYISWAGCVRLCEAGSHHNIILVKYVVIERPRRPGRQEQQRAVFVFTAVMRSKCQNLNSQPTLHDRCISLFLSSLHLVSIL